MVTFHVEGEESDSSDCLSVTWSVAILKGLLRIMGKYMTLSHWLIYILSQRLVVEAYTRCDNAAFAIFVSAISRTN